MKLNILHLSDWHIGHEHFNKDELVNNIILALSRNKPIDLIVFTGDIVDGPSRGKVNVETICESFDMLINQINYNINNRHKPLSKFDILFVPGNHECARIEECVDISEEKKRKKQFELYNNFLDRFYNNDIPSFYLIDNDYCVFREFKKEKIIFIGFNSANYDDLNKNNTHISCQNCNTIVPLKKYCSECGSKLYYVKNYKSYGNISTCQMSAIRNKFFELENYKEYKSVVFLHHHFYIMEERNIAYEDVSYIRNSEQFLEEISRYNVSIILHGHKHATKNKRMIINNPLRTKEQEKIATIFACGSLNKGDVNTNNFNFFEVYSTDEKHDVRCIEFSAESSNFKETCNILLPFEFPRFSKYGLEHSLKNSNTLYNQYIKLNNELSNYLIEKIENCICTIEKCNKDIMEDSKLALVCLVAINYRYNLKAVTENCKFYLDQALEILKENFLEIFSLMKELLNEHDLYIICNKYIVFIKSANHNRIKYLSYLTITIFLTELYLSICVNPSAFYEKYLKYKTDIDNVNQISLDTSFFIHTDEKRSSIGVSFKAQNAISHKVICLILQEFYFILNKLEEGFLKVGFDIFYIVAENEEYKLPGDLSLKASRFTAYLPKLIPLLAGENIYPQPETFTRELIQNAVDAIYTEKKYGGLKDNGEIVITINKENDNNGNEFHTFEIKDNGCGMDKYILERYFMSIGRSFYKSDDFQKLMERRGIQHIPISQFGIGFLSCFLVARRIEVYTKYHKEDAKGYFLDIPNLDGCFFIQERTNIEAGTIIKVIEYKNEDGISKFDTERIIDYIKYNILSIPFNLQILDKSNGNIIIDIKKCNLLRSLKEKTKKRKLLFFFPIFEDIYLNPNNGYFWEEFDPNKNNEYGIIVYKKDESLYESQKIIALNQGILIENTGTYDESLKNFFGHYFDIVMYLKGNEIEIDVSRSSLLQGKLLDCLSKLNKKIFSDFIYKFRNVNTIPYCILGIFNHEEYNINKIIISTNKNGNFKLCLTEKSSPKHFLDFFYKISKTKFGIMSKQIKSQLDRKINELQDTHFTYSLFWCYYFIINFNSDSIKYMCLFIDTIKNKEIEFDIKDNFYIELCKKMARDISDIAAKVISYDKKYAVNYSKEDISIFRACRQAADMNEDIIEYMDKVMDTAINTAMKTAINIGCSPKIMHIDSDDLRNDFINKLFYNSISRLNNNEQSISFVLALINTICCCSIIFTYEDFRKGIEFDLKEYFSFINKNLSSKYFD